METLIYENKICKRLDGKIVAEVTFPKVNDWLVDINHTFVDNSLRGKGVASELMLLVVKELEKSNRKAICSCSYAINWFDKHLEYRNLLND